MLQFSNTDIGIVGSAYLAGAVLGALFYLMSVAMTAGVIAAIGLSLVRLTPRPLDLRPRAAELQGSHTGCPLSRRDQAGAAAPIAAAEPARLPRRPAEPT